MGSNYRLQEREEAKGVIKCCLLHRCTDGHLLCSAADGAGVRNYELHPRKRLSQWTRSLIPLLTYELYSLIPPILVHLSAGKLSLSLSL